MRTGDTFFFEKTPYIHAYAACTGKKEGEGPLGRSFDHVSQDNRFGQKTWEQAESRMIQTAYTIAMKKAGLSRHHIDLCMGGDLLNQCIATSFGMRQLGAPFLGLYGACSTMAEGLLIGSVMTAAGWGKHVLCTAASHFCSAERQYRFPLEYGGQRPPTAQWTATAAGAVILTPTRQKVRVTAATPGRIFDPGVTDANNMGAAMAQSAYETLRAFFRDSDTGPDDYDLIATGDLAQIGAGIVRELFAADGVTLGHNYTDCGLLLYSKTQDVHAGASGCGCSAAVLCGHILPRLESGKLRRVLFCGTGALLSPTSAAQGESIPGVCHLVCLEGCV